MYNRNYEDTLLQISQELSSAAPARLDLLLDLISKLNDLNIQPSAGCEQHGLTIGEVLMARAYYWNNAELLQTILSKNPNLAQNLSLFKTSLVYGYTAEFISWVEANKIPDVPGEIPAEYNVNTPAEYDFKGSSAYEILGIKESSTPAEIKKSFLKLSLQYHPDKNKDRQNINDIVTSINNAYKILSNHLEREKYNAWLSFRKEQEQIKSSRLPKVKSNVAYANALTIWKNAKLTYYRKIIAALKQKSDMSVDDDNILINLLKNDPQFLTEKEDDNTLILEIIIAFAAKFKVEALLTGIRLGIKLLNTAKANIIFQGILFDKSINNYDGFTTNEEREYARQWLFKNWIIAELIDHYSNSNTPWVINDEQNLLIFYLNNVIDWHDQIDKQINDIADEISRYVKTDKNQIKNSIYQELIKIELYKPIKNYKLIDSAFANKIDLNTPTFPGSLQTINGVLLYEAYINRNVLLFKQLYQIMPFSSVDQVINTFAIFGFNLQNSARQWFYQQMINFEIEEYKKYKSPEKLSFLLNKPVLIDLSPDQIENLIHLAIGENHNDLLNTILMRQPPLFKMNKSFIDSISNHYKNHAAKQQMFYQPLVRYLLWNAHCIIGIDWQIIKNALSLPIDLNLNEKIGGLDVSADVSILEQILVQAFRLKDNELFSLLQKRQPDLQFDQSLIEKIAKLSGVDSKAVKTWITAKHVNELDNELTLKLNAVNKLTPIKNDQFNFLKKIEQDVTNSIEKFYALQKEWIGIVKKMEETIPDKNYFDTKRATLKQLEASINVLNETEYNEEISDLNSKLFDLKENFNLLQTNTEYRDILSRNAEISECINLIIKHKQSYPTIIENCNTILIAAKNQIIQAEANFYKDIIFSNTNLLLDRVNAPPSDKDNYLNYTAASLIELKQHLNQIIKDNESNILICHDLKKNNDIITQKFTEFLPEINKINTDAQKTVDKKLLAEREIIADSFDKLVTNIKSTGFKKIINNINQTLCKSFSVIFKTYEITQTIISLNNQSQFPKSSSEMADNKIKDLTFANEIMKKYLDIVEKIESKVKNLNINWESFNAIEIQNINNYKQQLLQIKHDQSDNIQQIHELMVLKIKLKEIDEVTINSTDPIIKNQIDYLVKNLKMTKNDIDDVITQYANLNNSLAAKKNEILPQNSQEEINHFMTGNYERVGFEIFKDIQNEILNNSHMEKLISHNNNSPKKILAGEYRHAILKAENLSQLIEAVGANPAITAPDGTITLSLRQNRPTGMLSGFFFNSTSDNHMVALEKELRSILKGYHTVYNFEKIYKRHL